ncbi:MAG: type II secretion system protein [Puniceicoccales bacterium]
MSRRGFTLIELLTAVAIIGILSSLLIVAVGEVRFASHKNQSASNIRQLAVANELYAADHGNYSPNANFRDTIHWHGKRVGGDFDGTGGYLSPYLDGGKVRLCPVFEDLLEDEEGAQFDEGTGGYGYNATYYGGRPDLWNMEIDSGVSLDDYQPWWARGNLPARIIDRPNTVMFTSTAIVRGGGVVETGNSVPYHHLRNGRLGERATPTCHFRFRGEAVVAWGDGHVSFESINEEYDSSHNVYDGNNDLYRVGWFGPVDWNGYWNPRSKHAQPY